MAQGPVAPEGGPDRPPPRAVPAGVYLLSAGCLVVACVAATSIPADSLPLQAFDVLVATLGVAFAVGLALRLRPARALLMLALALSLLVEALLFGIAWGRGEGMHYGRVFLRVGLTAWALVYLLRPDVARAFGARGGAGPEAASSPSGGGGGRPRLGRQVSGGLVGLVAGFGFFLLLFVARVFTNAGYHTTNVVLCLALVVGGITGVILRSR